jgi:alanine racemase
MSSAPDTRIAAHRPTFAEVDLDAFNRNLGAVQRSLPASSRLIPVLKADAYGHGAVELARVCQSAGVPMIAVGLLEEALELRGAGISCDILILGPLTRTQTEHAVGNGFVLGITGPESLHQAAAVDGKPVRIHLKLDSGMGRMGLVEDDLEEAARALRAARWVSVEAIYSHFASASDPDDPFTGSQIERFDAAVQRLRVLGITAPVHHLANSAATMRKMVRPGDLVRVGLSLYGAEPLDSGDSRLEPVMTFRTAIARLKEIPAGGAVGYGATFLARRPSRIATLPVGYADGYNRLLSNCGEVLVHGRRVPVVGRVSMDLVTIDVTEIDPVAVGDPVVLFGPQGEERITVEEIAQKIGTIPYEVLCGVSARVPRFFRSGSVTFTRSRFDHLLA